MNKRNEKKGHTIELSSRSNVIWNTRKNFDDLPWFSRYSTLIPLIYFEFIQLCFCSYSLQDWKLDRCNKNRARTFIGFDENDACREEGRIIPMDHMTGGYCVRIHLKKKDIELFSPHRFYIIQNSFTYKYWSPFICVCLFSLCLFFNCSSIFWNLFFFLFLFYQQQQQKKTIPHPLSRPNFVLTLPVRIF